LGIAPFSTSENSTNPEREQSNSFKLEKASDDVNETGRCLIDLQLSIHKVDNIFEVFNAGRPSKEDIDLNLRSYNLKKPSPHYKRTK
jgi:hypothetical protein